MIINRAKRAERKRREEAERQEKLNRRKERLEQELDRLQNDMWSKPCPIQSNSNIFSQDTGTCCSSDCVHFHAGSVYQMPNFFDNTISQVHLDKPKCKLWGSK